VKSSFLRASALLVLVAISASEATAQTASPNAGSAPIASRSRATGNAAGPSDAEIAAQRRSAELQLKRREDAAKRTLGSICNGC